MLGMAAFYWDALISMASAWQRPEYSYGPMVPLITAYLALREMHHRPPAAAHGSATPGFVILAAGMVLGLLGNLAQVQDIGGYGFILALGGLVLILAGVRDGIRFWPGWVHLFFMLPLPQILYLQISTSLQSLSSRLGVGLIDALGIPVFLDGNIIDLGTYQLQVAEACSGLNYLFPMLSFGWLVAALYVGPNWQRVVIFLSSIPLTILMNAFRIGVIGVLVNHYGIGQAEGFLHFFEGWVVFIACTAILYGEAWLLHRFATGRNRPPVILDLDHRGLLAPLRKLPHVRAGTPLAAAALLMLCAGVLWQAQPDRRAAPVSRESLALFPLALGDWRGEPSYLDQQTLKVLGADDYLSASYAQGAQRVDLLMTFYANQTGGKGSAHSPEVCLPAGGWNVSQWSRKAIVINGAAPRSLLVNSAVIQKGPQRQLVYYWFEQRGVQTAGEYEARLLTLRDAITLGRSDGGLVRLVTPIDAAGDMRAAEARLENLLQQIIPKLPAYFPPS